MSSIYDNLRGNDHKEKYEYLMKCLKLLQQIAYPRRRTKEESMDVYEFAVYAQKLVDMDIAIPDNFSIIED